MATLKTSIALYDGVTAPLQNMTRAMNILINSFESMQHASSEAIDVASLQQARECLAQADTAYDSIAASIANADKQQKRFTDDIEQSESAVDRLTNRLTTMAAGYGIGQVVDKLVGMSDQAASTNARLSLLVDDGGSVAASEDKVMASAMRSRAAYNSVADAVAKLDSNAGSAFNNDMDQVVNFAELVNKQFVIAGASATEASNAMLQLTQAMGSGVLQGDELRSIFEQAPGLVQNIADYMGKPIGEIRQLAADGEITAEIVKNAMFAAADDINAKFNEMPMTWSQMWAVFSNVALTLLQPLLSGINWLANNISIIGPLVLGLGSAFTIFLIAANWTKIAAAATAAWTAAQAAFNAVMAANPVVRIVLVIMILVSVLYAAVAAYNRFTNKTVSATGIIVGVLAMAGAVVANIFSAIWNVAMNVFVSIYNSVATVANFLASVFVDPVGSVVRLFAGMVDSILNLLSGLASAIDSIFGSNLQSAVEGWRGSLSTKAETKFGKGNEIMAKLDATSVQLDRIDYGSAFNTGYDWGSSLAGKISDKFGLKSTDMQIPDVNDLANALDKSDAANKIANNTGSTAANTDDISDAIDLTNEDLKYLRDIAERETVNRYTTAAITVHQTNNNAISSDMDLDGIVEHLRSTVEEQMDAAAEGVH